MKKNRFKTLSGFWIPVFGTPIALVFAASSCNITAGVDGEGDDKNDGDDKTQIKEWNISKNHTLKFEKNKIFVDGFEASIEDQIQVIKDLADINKEDLMFTMVDYGYMQKDVDPWATMIINGVKKYRITFKPVYIDSYKEKGDNLLQNFNNEVINIKIKDNALVAEFQPMYDYTNQDLFVEDITNHYNHKHVLSGKTMKELIYELYTDYKKYGTIDVKTVYKVDATKKTIVVDKYKNNFSDTNFLEIRTSDNSLIINGENILASNERTIFEDFIGLNGSVDYTFADEGNTVHVLINEVNKYTIKFNETQKFIIN